MTLARARVSAHDARLQLGFEEERFLAIASGRSNMFPRRSLLCLLNVFAFDELRIMQLCLDWRLAWSRKIRLFEDFKDQILGYGLTTAEIVNCRPDHHWLLQTYIGQDCDTFPNFSALRDFLAFWATKLDGPLLAVTVSHSKLIKPAELRAADGVFRLH
jgi:uncharacterized protein Usg